MLEINLNVPLKNLDNQPVIDAQGKVIILGQALAHVLTNGSKGNAIKHYDWAMTMWKGETLKVDESDAKMLRTLIEESEIMTILAKAQIIKIIDVAIASR